MPMCKKAEHPNTTVFSSGAKILLADEPTGNLDQETGAMIIDLLFNLSSEHNRSLVLITHDPQIAAKSDRRIGLRDGQIIHDSGSP